MRYEPEKHHRRSLRLKGYDYSQAGAYFVTICTQSSACLFGEVVDGRRNVPTVPQRRRTGPACSARWWMGRCG